MRIQRIFFIDTILPSSIEHHLFKSLIKVCLIESRETSNYHRCGRTDKGVSAFSQVISIDVRSKFPPEEQMKPEAIKNEMNYCEALNRVLPENIKCVAWAPVQNPVYSARYLLVFIRVAGCVCVFYNSICYTHAIFTDSIAK